MGARPYSAIRVGNWKLIQLHQQMDQPELYDLAKDIHEDHNLATENPDKASELLAKLNAWRKSVDAQMPTTNPDYDSSQPTGRPDRQGKIKPIVAVRE